MILSVYVVAGLIFAIAGWVLIGRVNAASPNSGIDANLDSITAVVIGGTSLFGGRGRVIGSLIGALIVTSVDHGLSVAGLDQNLQAAGDRQLDHRCRHRRPVDSQGQGMSETIPRR